jgi:hypothetical protein
MQSLEHGTFAQRQFGYSLKSGSSQWLSSARVTGKPHLTACFSDWSRHAASDSGICQFFGNAASGSIMLHSVAAFHLQPAGSSELEEKLPKTPL